MNTITKIKQAIMADVQNEKYTKKGIEPLFSAPAAARIVVVGQAPGIHAQQNRIYWKDRSGALLRQWMDMNEEEFYSTDKLSILPMDFYYPGKGKSGDLPPRKGFAAKWHPLILKTMPDVKLFILIGHYAQQYYIAQSKGQTLTQIVKNYKSYLPEFFPIVHPSPLNIRWRKKNPWFEEIVLPDFKKRIKEVLYEL